ncbi:hypothetical protein B566_EDAN002765 [Ephemera danica]|nr:hypothetical protein B566_EDAN002765 [Ephemera danica]
MLLFILSTMPMGVSPRIYRGLAGLVLLCCLHLSAAIRTHREHKVHNIVLYPDKHSWCKTTPIKQVVAWPGCVAREIDNNVCVGACFSYTIPQTQPSAPGDVISPYCDSCQPSEVTWQEFTLECSREEETMETTLAPESTTPGSTSGANSTLPPLFMQKRVQVIDNCSCSACHGHAHHHVSPSDAHGDAEVVLPQPSLLEAPELMGLVRQAHMRKLAANQSNSARPPEPSTFPVVSSISSEHLQPVVPSVEHLHPVVSSVSSEHHPVVPSVSSEHHLVVPATSSELHHHPVESEAFEPPVPLHETAVHPHHGHGGHHQHAHHPHHHGHHHGAGSPPTHLEVPQDKLQPAQEGAEMSYHDNLVPTDQSSERDQEQRERVRQKTLQRRTSDVMQLYHRFPSYYYNLFLTRYSPW